MPPLRGPEGAQLVDEIGGVLPGKMRHLAVPGDAILAMAGRADLGADRRRLGSAAPVDEARSAARTTLAKARLLLAPRLLMPR